MKNLLKDLRSDYFAIYPFSIVLKHYLNRLPIRKLFISPIYFLAFLLTSCLNDTITQNQNHLSNGHNKNIKYVSISEIPGIIPNIQEFNRSYNFLSSSFQSTNRSVENLNLDLNKILVYTKSDSLKSYSITILNTLEASETYYFENLHIIEKETTNEILIFRWTPNNKEIPFNSKTFSGNLKVFDKNYQLITSKSFANGTSDPVSDEYQMGCDILVDCNCPGDPWCGCDGSYPNCVNSFTLFCTLGGGGSGGGNSGSGGTGSGGSSGGGGSGSGNSGTGNPPSGPTIEDANNGILAVIPIKPNTIEEVKDPCANLKNLFDPNKANIKQNIINDLQPNIAVNPSGEKAVSLTRTPEGVPTNTIIPPTPTNFVNIRAGGNRYSAIHTHPLDTYPMFSWSDVVVVNTLNNHAAPHNQGMASFLLVCQDDNGAFQTYAIVFDPNSLNETIDEFMNNPENIGCTSQEIEKKMNKVLGDLYANDNNYERVFLKFMSSSNVSLYKANSSLTNWSKLTLSNNSASPRVIPKNCN